MHQRMDPIMWRFHGVALAVAAVAVLAPLAGPSGARAQDAAPPPVSPVMKVPVEQSRAAIAECRDRRLRKELTTYRQSAQCSSQKIFAAWRDAGYPHMDLIAEWLTAREEASDKVDQRLITPKEFDEQMDALTIRLTAEEHRRRAGLLASADSDLKLQLPPAAEVVGVAAPPEQDKQAAKLSAAARQRAGFAVATAQPSSNPSVGAMGQLTPLDPGAAKPGVGGPLAPLPLGPGSSGMYAQVAAQLSEADARSAYRYLQGRYPDLLGGREAVIRRADEGPKGTFYRVEVGPLTSSQVDQLCGSIKAGGGQCIPRYE